MPKTQEEKRQYLREYYHKYKVYRKIKLTRNKLGQFENKNRIIINETDIVNMYINKSLSTGIIGKIYNVDKTIIRRILLKNNITLRKRQHASSLIAGGHSAKWSGFGEISGSKWATIKIGAKKRGIKFDITIEQVWNLFIQQNRKCALTGQSIGFPNRHKEYINGDWTASLDRIDSNKGYIIDNIRWVHKWVNCMKWDLSDKDFFDICKSVVIYNNL